MDLHQDTLDDGGLARAPRDRIAAQELAGEQTGGVGREATAVDVVPTHKVAQSEKVGSFSRVQFGRCTNDVDCNTRLTEGTHDRLLAAEDA